MFDPATGLTTRYPFNAGWSWDDENRGLDARPDKVKLALDKTGYRAGDTLKVTVTPPHRGQGPADGRERPHAVRAGRSTPKPGSTFEIPVTKDWERHDVYVTALVFRGGSRDRARSRRRAPSAWRTCRWTAAIARVAVGVAAPQADAPGAGPAGHRQRAASWPGKQAYVTVSAVDVGILNITRFPVPDANAQFFAQRRLGVDAYDIYGRVIESFEGGTAKIRFGGDMALAALPQARAPDLARADGRPVRRPGASWMRRAMRASS